MSLQALNLSCIRSDFELFAGIGFSLSSGEAMRVAGGNGSGKTSLLRILCGLAEAATGEVRWDGGDIRGMRDEYNGKLLYLGHASGLKDDLLAWENLAMSATLAGAAVDMASACAALRELGLAHAAELPARLLSQGQRKRVALARLRLAPPRPLWILDEPFTALDAGAVDGLRVVLDRHLAQGGMLVYTTHQEIALASHRHVRLDLGRSGSC